MLYYVKLHEIRFYFCIGCLPDALPGLPPRSDAFRARKTLPHAAQSDFQRQGGHAEPGSPIPGGADLPPPQGPIPPAGLLWAIYSMLAFAVVRLNDSGPCARLQGSRGVKVVTDFNADLKCAAHIGNVRVESW